MAKRKTFQFSPFSVRQKRILTWWHDDSPVKDYDGIIADGSIRSGKTLPMSVSFVLWAMERFNGEAFGLCGKTIGAFRRNVLRYMKQTLPPEGYRLTEYRNENKVVVSYAGRENEFYLFGGRDERSQDLVQGVTLAGALFDEVALMPESFVNQVVGRCSVDGAKLWFNCNPEYPAHWFRQEWILKHDEKRLLYLHFTMEDNLSLSDRIRERYRSYYTGVFYKRFILGLWTAAEGVIYQDFADDPEPFILDIAPHIVSASIGVDFGGTKSAHAFVCVGFTAGYKSIVVLDEYYHDNMKDGRLSPAQLDEAFVSFVREQKSKYQITGIYCDSAEQTLIQGFQIAALKAHIGAPICNAIKGEINERIAFYNAIMSQKRFFVMRKCKAVIAALQEAVYADDQKDKRLDNGTTNVDSLDALEYSTEPWQDIILYKGL